MFCTQCGTKLGTDTKFCTNCGNPSAIQAKVSSSSMPKISMPKQRNAGTIIGIVAGAVIFIVIIVAAVNFFVGGNDSRLVGRWEMVSTTNPALSLDLSLGVDFEYRLSANGTGAFYASALWGIASERQPFTWRTRGSRFSRSGIPGWFTFEFSGFGMDSRLTFTGSDGTYTFRRVLGG